MPDALSRTDETMPAPLPPDSGAPRRSPPKAVKCIVPVWGYRFVRQFLELGLPTWLAPGNIPALAAALPCEFIILTSRDDEPFLHHHPTFQRLSEVCPVSLRRIDHLITGTNYSTTLTLAYAEAVRAEGPAMLDTCFFFLVSDYIVADGSFGNVLARVIAGASGILVGNFQVALEDALPWLQDRLVTASGAVSLTSRQLMRWALSHLHPVTVANIVNYPLNSNIHTNRLFWRVDGKTLLGRFYLMHMICIRPELTDFVIGSSCDYSFIPEMCPSNNVEIIRDSDDYLVIEMQPRDHESKFLRPGPLRPRLLAKTLSEWTTARHRENSFHSLIFHADEIPGERVAQTQEAVEKFLAAVRKFMRRRPKPHRHHPYWRGALAAHHEATGRRLSYDEWRRVMGIPDPSGTDSWLNRWVVDRIRFALFGRPPHVRPWHPRWPDYNAVIKELSGFFDNPRDRLLMISDTPTIFTASLIDDGERVMRVRLTPFLESSAEAYQPMFDRFDSCLLEIGERELHRADELIDRVAPMMKPGGKIVLVVYNKRDSNFEEFFDSIAFHSPRLLRPSTTAPRIRFVPAGRFRSAIMRAMMHIARTASRRPLLGVPLLLISGAVLAPACLIANVVGRDDSSRTMRRGARASSLVMTLEIAGAAGCDAYRYSADRIVRQRQRLRLGGLDEPVPADSLRGSLESQPAPGKETSSPPAGSHGLMNNRDDYDDPRRLAILLARYKFVAEMLSGKRHVAEVGCGDACGTRVVAQETAKVVAYDMDRRVIEDIRQRYSDRWPVEAQVHDIVLAPLPARHDGLYSLDVIERISRADEHAYLSNLRGSLTSDGVLIIGTPSPEQPPDASPLRKAGRINCKTGDELKVLLQQYFENVFLFSMNDEVVHTGLRPMAQYLLAVCCGKK